MNWISSFCIRGILHTYYLTVSVSQESSHGLAKAPVLVTRKAAKDRRLRLIKTMQVSTKDRYYSEFTWALWSIQLFVNGWMNWGFCCVLVGKGFQQFIIMDIS